MFVEVSCGSFKFKVAVEYEGTVINIKGRSEIEAFAFCVCVLFEESAFTCVCVTVFVFWEVGNSMGCASIFRVSRKACMTKRNRTGDVLSP